MTLSVQGKDRLVYGKLPDSGVSEPYPLFIDMHGYGGNAAFHLPKTCDRNSVGMMVWPEGDFEGNSMPGRQPKLCWNFARQLVRSYQGNDSKSGLASFSFARFSNLSGKFKQII